MTALLESEYTIFEMEYTRFIIKSYTNTLWSNDKLEWWKEEEEEKKK